MIKQQNIIKQTVLLALLSLPILSNAHPTLLSDAQLSSGGFFGLTTGLSVIILTVIIFVLLGIFITLLVLSRLKNELDKAQWEKDHPGEQYHSDKTFFEQIKAEGQIFFNRVNPNFVIVSVIGIIGLFSMVDWYQRAQDLGTQHGYAPEQPIKFNHKLHAGELGIQCQYCHTGAEKGKQAGIPPISTCMNCHSYVKEGAQYGNVEINKIKEAYNTKKPVRWVRIHNLPDHVYFNHSQHVVAGKVKCQTCHGAVQEMAKVQQISTLEMGWCINCHREMKIDDKNPYYASTYDFVKKHKEIQKNGASYTVAQMGGLECSKCHY